MSAGSISVLNGSGSAVSLGTMVDAASNQSYQVSGDSAIAHYSASSSRLAPVATPTAVYTFFGSATKTIRIKRIELSGAATSAGSMKVQLKKNSDAGTIGSAVATALTAVPHDSGAAAATGTVSSIGTANYTTVPTIVGAVRSGELEMGVLATGVFNPLIWEFGKDGRQALVLRGILQSVTIDLLGATLPSGGVVDFNVEWSEDSS